MAVIVASLVAILGEYSAYKRCLRVSACFTRYTFDLVCRRRGSCSNESGGGSDIGCIKGVCECQLLLRVYTCVYMCLMHVHGCVFIYV